MANYNHQPIFTSTPIHFSKTFRPDLVAKAYDVAYWLTAASTVYTVGTTGGELIERITITTCGDVTTNNHVTNHLAYVFLFQDKLSTYSLYKTFAIPDTMISATVPNPSYELVFTGGIILDQGDTIVVASSIDATYTTPADYFAVVIEGSSYTNIY